MSVPFVAIVGRPNVGKSTLVNRLAQINDAIVHEQRGVTRDRSYHRADWNGRDFLLVDTGGIEEATDDAFGSSIRSQALTAASEADAIIFLVDASTGVVAGDEEVARLLRGRETPIFLVVNKMDNPVDESRMHEFWALGLGQPWPVSATHGHGTGDLLDEVVASLPDTESEEAADEIRVAIIGKPNAGKSSLYNRLLGTERAIVSEVAGTTRDALDTVLERNGVRYRLIDTAGLRRKSKIDESVEYYGFVRAMRAIDRADVALLVVDCAQGITDQDQRVARFAEDRGSGLIVLLNKWDLLEDDEARDVIMDQIDRHLAFVGFAPVIRTSALTGRGMRTVLNAVDQVYEAFTQEISTSALNRLLTELRATGHTISKQGKSLRLQYMTQTRSKPPGFTFFANHPRMVDTNYKRYLENRLREKFDFTGTPIRLFFRAKD
jgi:GTP-binding protein